MLKLKTLYLVLLMCSLFWRLNGRFMSLSENPNKLEDDDDDDADYSWDYDDDSEDKPKMSKQVLISLTRDWFGRENPDAYPTHGFFPVWAFALLIIAAFFLVIAIISGMLHAFGCRGRRPVETKSGERRLSAPLIEIPRKYSRGDHQHEPSFVGSGRDIASLSKNREISTHNKKFNPLRSNNPQRSK